MAKLLALATPTKHIATSTSTKVVNTPVAKYEKNRKTFAKGKRKYIGWLLFQFL